MTKILITGGSGFLGTHVVNAVKGYDIFVPRSNEYDLRRNYDTQQLFMTEKPNIVIHLAATCGGIGANMNNPGQYFYDNITMGVNVIDCCKGSGVSKIIMVGTVCSYPKHCAVPFSEDDLWYGFPEETNAPYGIAKKALYVMLEAYRKQYGLNSTVLIPSNLYGPCDNFKDESSHVIPALIKKIHNAKTNDSPTVEVWGDGTCTREFLYVKDAAEAIKNSIKVNTDSNPINLGTGIEISIEDLVYKIKRIMNYEGEIIFNNKYPNGQPRRCVSTIKASKILDFQAKYNLDIGLKETIDWYLTNKTPMLQ
tara:strand:+ start:7 stop:933 length:927 start_codon:yes stop_codon:yes gene_type:complete